MALGVVVSAAVETPILRQLLWDKLVALRIGIGGLQRNGLSGICSKLLHGGRRLRLAHPRRRVQVQTRDGETLGWRRIRGTGSGYAGTTTVLEARTRSLFQNSQEKETKKVF